jgi:hypothetical protein
VTYNIPAVKIFLEQLVKEGNYSAIMAKGKSAHIMAIQIALEVISEAEGGSDIGKIDGIL